MDNTELWNSVCKTDPAHTKGFQRTGGFKGTAIKPLYLIHKATELWGPIGDEWGAETAEYVISGNTVFIKARVWYPGKRGKATVEHWGGDVLVKGDKANPNDEAFKMAFTDAIGKCLVQLGFSADVHLGRFDDSKYVEELNVEFGNIEAVTHEQAMEIDLLITEAKADKAGFLKFIGVSGEDVRKIPAAKYEVAVAALKKKKAAA